MKEMKKKCTFTANTDYHNVLYGRAFVPQIENRVVEGKLITSMYLSTVYSIMYLQNSFSPYLC